MCGPRLVVDGCRNTCSGGNVPHGDGLVSPTCWIDGLPHVNAASCSEQLLVFNGCVLEGWNTRATCQPLHSRHRGHRVSVGQLIGPTCDAGHIGTVLKGRHQVCETGAVIGLVEPGPCQQQVGPLEPHAAKGCLGLIEEALQVRVVPRQVPVGHAAAHIAEQRQACDHEQGVDRSATDAEDAAVLDEPCVVLLECRAKPPAEV
mmetsp:Transcript_97930/g.253241  ORF Transcript_97930/g.253241 Transcript_97930/m.253241 type:complete len:203 (-) Transcript_97930:1575-2183(-)